MSRPPMNPSYRTTRFLAELPRGGMPVRFGVVTACDPVGKPRADAENDTATATFQNELLREGVTFFPVTGGSPDFSHAEPGFGIVLGSLEEALALGRRWQQEAVFWVEYGEVLLCSCTSEETVHIGKWSERAESPLFHYMGNVALLEERKTALFSSAKCPGDAILHAHDRATAWRDEGRCVVSGFHSPVEQDCLRILLRGKQPVIVCPARAIPRRIPADWQRALDGKRLLIVSPFGFHEKRISAALAERRNEFVASLAEEAWFAHIAPGGSMERLSRILAAKGIPLSSR